MIATNGMRFFSPHSVNFPAEQKDALSRYNKDSHLCVNTIKSAKRAIQDIENYYFIWGENLRSQAMRDILADLKKNKSQLIADLENGKNAISAQFVKIKNECKRLTFKKNDFAKQHYDITCQISLTPLSLKQIASKQSNFRLPEEAKSYLDSFIQEEILLLDSHQTFLDHLADAPRGQEIDYEGKKYLIDRCNIHKNNIWVASEISKTSVLQLNEKIAKLNISKNIHYTRIQDYTKRILKEKEKGNNLKLLETKISRALDLINKL